MKLEEPLVLEIPNCQARCIIFLQNSASLFIIFWYFIILLPTSSILPIEDVMYERRLYLASLGWIMLFLLVIKNIKYNYVRLCLLVLIVFSLSIWTYQRNVVWKDELSL